MRLTENIKKWCLAFLFMAVWWPLSAFGTLPDRVFAPYIDITLWPTPSLVEIYEETGQKYFTLAFITESGTAQPGWGGQSTYGTDFYADEIAELRALGGDVIVSFGGANGTELALSVEDEAELLAAYQGVIDAYDLTWVDFDIEGAAVADTASIDRRNRVIKQLQDANPDLKVAFCLPVLPTGLTSDGLYVIQSAIEAGVDIDVVNVMAMDYGDSAAPDPDGQMGDYAIQAAENTYEQILALGIDTDVTMGVTPMIGYNDVTTEVFYLSDAATLLSWAQSSSEVSLLSMWSVSRDNGDCDVGTVSAKCSGLEIEDYAYTTVFQNYTVDGSGGNLWPSVSITSPADGDTFDLDETITITADASDSDGSITQVEFLVDGTTTGTDAAAPYSMTWSTSTSGMVDLTAVATDDTGAQVTSSTVTIVVGEDVCTADEWDEDDTYTAGDVVSYNGHEWEAKWWTQGDEPDEDDEWGVWEDQGTCNSGSGGGSSSGNQAPEVSITCPEDGDVYTVGDSVTIEADASDEDGTIAQVEFFYDGTSLGVDDESPFAVEWAEPAAGSYDLTAVATDDQGDTTTSETVAITVQSSSQSTGSCADLLDYPQGLGDYDYGQQVQNNGSIYQVREWPYGAWANIDAADYYEPGVGSDWEDAWEYVGDCE